MKEEKQEKINIGDIGENRFFKWVKNNQMSITAFIVGIALGVFVMGLLWPDRIVKLADGSEVIATLKGRNFTADDIYQDMVDANGLNTLLDQVDLAILKEKYDLEEEAMESAKSQAEEIYQSYEETYQYTKDQFLEMNGFGTENAFLEYLKNDYYFKKYFEDFLVSKISDKEAKKYYDNTVKGTKKVQLFISTTDDADLKKIKKALDKGQTLSSVSKKYSNVTLTDLGSVSFNSYGDYSETLIKQLGDLKKGETSDVFEDSTYGYALLYVEDTDKKRDFDDIKEDIKKILGTELANKDENLYFNAFFQLRDAYDFEIKDSKLASLYSDYKKSHK